jgi:hypothetical protein
MKKTTLTAISAFLIAPAFCLLMLNSCVKSEDAMTTTPIEFAGNWKLSDLMMVNAGDKPPRKLETMPRLNDLRLNMSPDGKLSGNGPETGSWSVVNDHLLIRYGNEEPMDLKVSKIERGILVVEHQFDSAKGSAGGTIYFAFAK